MLRRNVIRVLVIDDNWLDWATVEAKDLPPEIVLMLRRIAGEAWYGYSHVPGVRDDSEDGSLPELPECFEVRVIRSVEEGRRYRDLCVAIASVAPGALGEHGWAPDIVCFDYALTQNREDWAWWASSVSSPLPALESLANELGLKPASSYVQSYSPGSAVAASHSVVNASAGVKSQPDVQFSLGNDNFGCFTGALIILCFNDYPCGGVPVTKKEAANLSKAEVRVLEWFLQSDFRNVFETKHEMKFNWSATLKAGVGRFREKFEQLSLSNVISPSITDLLEMEAGNEPAVLRFSSRYGQRTLPVAGLFIDVPKAAPADADDAEPSAEQWPAEDEPPSTRSDFIRSWARKLLGALLRHAFDPQGGLSAELEDLRAGLYIKEKLWAAYQSPESERRYRLSELTAKAASKRGAAASAGEAHSNSTKVQGLTTAEAKDLETLRADFKVSNDSITSDYEGSMSFRDFKNYYSDRALRWAALFVIVQLEKLRRDAHKAWADAGMPSNFIDTPGTEPLTANDVYLALYPIPGKTVVTPLHNNSSDYGTPLRRLDSQDRPASLHDVVNKGQDNWGNLALKLDHVIGSEPRPWKEDSNLPVVVAFKVGEELTPDKFSQAASRIEAEGFKVREPELSEAGSAPSKGAAKKREAHRWVEFEARCSAESIGHLEEYAPQVFADLGVKVLDVRKTAPPEWSYGLLPGEAFILESYANDLGVRGLHWLKIPARW